jgi:hyperosmotically inducible periplasmic protein
MMRIAKPVVLGVCLFLFAAAFEVRGLGAFQQGPPSRGSANYDQWLKQEVRHRLVMLPWYSIFDNLAYSVNGYNVTLEGQVVNPSLKPDAERAVKSIEGVERVDNKIEVLPPSPMDDQIRRAEYRAIYGFPSLQRYAMGAVPPIHIIVKNGRVTLVGVVANQADKDAAGIRANTVPNVFAVTNNLTVENQNSSGK